MNNIVIRKAIPEDAETIIDINIKVWNSTYKNIVSQEIIDKIQVKNKERIELQEKIIEGAQNVYVALVNGLIVGYESFGKSYDEKYENSGEIYTAYILDNYQNLGLGRQMAIACMKELLNKGYITLVTKCLEGNPSNEFHKSLGGVLVGQSTFKPMGIYVGKENVYYHEDLTKSLEYNIEKLNKKNIK